MLLSIETKLLGNIFIAILNLVILWTGYFILK